MSASGNAGMKQNQRSVLLDGSGFNWVTSKLLSQPLRAPHNDTVLGVHYQHDTDMFDNSW